MSTAKRMAAEYQAVERSKAERLLKGRTINEVEVGTAYDRTYSLTLHLDNGSNVEIGFWASYADDAGLEFND